MSTIQTTENAAATRYVVVDAEVRDLELGRIARFEHPEAARLGADWLNGPDATADDYAWIDQLTVGEAFVIAGKMQSFLNSEGWDMSLPALVVALREASPTDSGKIIRRSADVDEQLMGLDA